MKSARSVWPEWSARTSLVVFALALCAVIVGAYAFDVLHGHGLGIAAAGDAAQGTVEALARQTGDTIEAIDGALFELAERVETDGSRPAARLRLRDTTAALVKLMPRVHGLLIVDAQGRYVVSNGSAEPRPDLNYSRAPFFLYHRIHASRGIHISGPRRGDTDSAWVIDLTRRIDRADGSFGGVAAAQVAIAYFDQSYAGADIGAGGAVELVAADGTVVFRRPRGSPEVNALAPAAFADPYKYAMSASYAGRSSLDGAQRFFAFARLDRYPLLVGVSLAEQDYLADWRADVLANGIVAGLVVALIGGLAFGLAGQIDRRKLAENDLKRLAIVDWLTGMANRRQFETVLEREWLRAARDRTPFAVLMIDVDNFKAYNDHYGHQRGDDVLVMIARTIVANVLRPADLAARYGGEEFAVVLPAADAAGAAVIAERIRAAVAALGVPHAAVASSLVSVSVGVAVAFPLADAQRQLLVEAADGALYAAKRAGRNCTVVAADDGADASSSGAHRATAAPAGSA